MPVSNCGTLKAPESLVVTVRSLPVWLSVTITVAPGTTPLGSEIVPTRFPVFCANAPAAERQSVSKIKMNLFIVDSLVVGKFSEGKHRLCLKHLQFPFKLRNKFISLH